MSSKQLLGVVLIAALAAGLWYGRSFLPSNVANSPPPDGPIIAFGDSLTQGFGAGPEDSYPAQLSKLIGRPILNRGLAGETIGDAQKRLERDVFAQKPGIVLICLGGNDLLRNSDADRAFQTLDAMVARITERGAMVVLIGVEGLPLLSEDFGKRYKALAKRRRCVYVPNILGGILGHTEFMADGIHPNGRGYEIFAGRVAKALKRHLR